MTFDEILGQALEMLQRRGRVSYRALKAQFQVDDELLDALKEEIIEVHQCGQDQGGRMLVWTGKDKGLSESTTSSSEPIEPRAIHEPSFSQAATHPRDDLTPEAERRQLTVMFCDLVGSTFLSGQLDPEDLRDVVQAYQSACTDVIQRFEGYVAQHLGDGILVYFGYPTAHENDAQRAVRTGLDMIDAMKTLNGKLEQTHGLQLAVRISAHTGLVVIGGIGSGDRQEQLALGEAPNIAARIQGLAEPDTLIVSDATHRLIQGYFDCESLGEQELKGVAEPMSVYQVLQESGAQSRLDITSARGLTPLIGREFESTLLFERWEQAKDEQGQVVLLSGEAGIGKSRLVQVLKDRVAERAHTCLECRSSPYFTNSALYPIIDMIRRTVQFQTDDTSEMKLKKLEQTLSQYGLPTTETVPLFAALLSLPVSEERYPPFTFSPQVQRQKTLQTIAAITLKLSERQPVLFILEDAHWLDASTQELMEVLIDQVPTSQILVLITYRPEFQPTWSNRSYLTQVTLNRLTRNQIEFIATQVASGKTLPDEVLTQLTERTDGVPLYVEEMTKSVLESGVLKEIKGQYELTGLVSSLAIPATLQDSLMARLDRLVTAKGVAQYASVIGRQFSYELLQAVSELDEAMLQHELERLVEAELVYQRGLPPQSTYTFKHALIQDTAYESLLRSTRQGYHRRIAEVLERQLSHTIESQPELLAHHYTEAGLNQAAITYWQRAGKKASERSAYQEALSHLTTGLDLLQTVPETLERHQQELTLQIELGAATRIAVGHGAPEVEAAYTRARVLCQQLEDTQDVFPALFGLLRFYISRSELSLAQQLGEELLNLAVRKEEPPLYVIAHYALGSTYLWMGELHSAHRYLEEGISHYTLAQSRSPMFRSGQDPCVSCLLFLAFTQWLRGYPDQALALAHEALLLATELDHPFSHVYALNFTSIVYQWRRQVLEVYRRAETALSLSTEQGFTLMMTLGIILQGWALTDWEHQEPRKGLTQMRQGLTDFRASGSELHVPYFLALVAEGCVRLNQVKAGLDALDEGMGVIKRTGHNMWEAEVHRLKGELLLCQTNPDVAQAETCFHQALHVSRHQQAKSLELRATTSLARLWQSQDKRQEAYDLLAPVYEWFTEGFDTADLKEANALLIELAR